MTATSINGGQQLDDIGPIDYVVLEWPGRKQPQGEIAPLLGDLVARGIIRVLDVAVMAKEADGTVVAMDLGSPEAQSALGDLTGASSGMLGDDDLAEAANALEPGTSAAILVWENSWAAPVAAAMRKSGGQLVASGRIPVQAIVAALDATETTS